MNILVSACLLGVSCRYDGTGCLLPELEELKKKHHLIPVCPEVYGGLTTPRPPAEIRDGWVVNREGEDVTLQYEKGAGKCLSWPVFLTAKRLSSKNAVLPAVMAGYITAGLTAE